MIGGTLVEGLTRGLMDRGATGEVLPASQDDIDIGRADLETDAGAAGHFGRDQAGARTEKRVIDQLAGPAVVATWFPTLPPSFSSGFVISLLRLLSIAEVRS